MPIYNLRATVRSGSALPLSGSSQDNTGELILTPKLTAQIFSGEVRHWRDPRIMAVNPELSTCAGMSNDQRHTRGESGSAAALGGSAAGRLNAAAEAQSCLPDAAITVVVREDKSGTTHIWKNSLAAVDANFRTHIGTSSDPVWNWTWVEKAREKEMKGTGERPTKGPYVVFADTNGGAAAFVHSVVGAIGYSVRRGGRSRERERERERERAGGETKILLCSYTADPYTFSRACAC